MTQALNRASNAYETAVVVENRPNRVSDTYEPAVVDRWPYREIGGNTVRTYDANELARAFPVLANRDRDVERTTYDFQPFATIDAIRHMEERGFRTYFYRSDKTRAKNPYAARHMVAMVGPNDFTGGTAETVWLMNANNGSKSLQIGYGAIRGVCYNSLFFGDVMAESGKIVHKGAQFQARIELAYCRIEAKQAEVGEYLHAMQHKIATVDDKMRMIQAVRDARPSLKNVAYSDILEPVRKQDTGGDVYTVMNVIQERAIRGAGARTTKGRLVSRLVGNTSTVQVNRALWSAATSLEY